MTTELGHSALALLLLPLQPVGLPPALAIPGFSDEDLRPKAAKKRAADDEVLRRMLAVVPATGLLGLRDRALLLLGWCGAFRRSELVALDVSAVTPAPKGRVVLVSAATLAKSPCSLARARDVSAGTQGLTRRR